MARTLNPFSLLRKGMDFPMGGDGGMGWGWTGSGSWGPWMMGAPYPSTRINYRIEAGDPAENSIVMAALNWITMTFPQAPMRVIQQGAQDPSLVKVLPGHGLTETVNRPNPYYPGLLLWQATLLSYWIDGTGYWLKLRDKSDRVQQFWYEPHYSIRPHWPRDGSVFIDGYQICRQGHWLTKPEELIPVRDVVHFRNGLDPANTRLGLSPLKSVLREIYTDNEAANFTATLLRNKGIPGVIVSPKALGSGGAGYIENPKGLKDTLITSTTGDRRGEPMVFSVPMQVQQLTVDPKSLSMDKLRGIPEFRVTGVLRVPAVVAGMGSSWSGSTFNNMKEAKATAWEENILPTHDVFGATLDVQALPDFGDETRETVDFDTRNVAALVEDQNDVYQRATEGYNAGWLKRKDSRQLVGLPFDPEADNVYKTDLPTRTETITEVADPDSIDLPDEDDGTEDPDESTEGEGDDEKSLAGALRSAIESSFDAVFAA